MRYFARPAFYAFSLFLLTFFCVQPASAQTRSATTSNDVAEPADNDNVAASPKSPWGDFEVMEEHETPWWAQALLWIPNRVLDLIDVFRVDAGIGPAAGGVIRITKYGQVGIRQVAPFSLRVGDFGREAPIMVERSNEFGIGPTFVNSRDRDVCTGEIGVGADVLIVGAYGGICVEELADFLAGLFFIDLMKDDLE